ncbi:MAG: hypothetical protein RLZZ590_542 [Actinomycetota bacterium]|jgi:ABC-type nitrate/sulfonate/bicarbonate transport system ATPase subunit
MGNLAASLVKVSISRSAAAAPVIENLDLEIHEGEILAVVGGSGRGKTTLLHALAGLLNVSAGEIRHFAAPGKKASGLVFQEALLLPWLSVRQNVRLGFRFKANRKAVGKNAAELDAKVTNLLKILGIAELADRKVNQLSGGQAQRVAIARTIVTEPKLLLLDEPFSALDAATRGGLQTWLKDLRAKLDLTIVIVTHDIDEALTVADRVLLLNEPGVAATSYSVSEGQNTNEGLKAEIISQLGYSI